MRLVAVKKLPYAAEAARAWHPLQQLTATYLQAIMPQPSLADLRPMGFDPVIQGMWRSSRSQIE
jgi:hypothetical protein